MANQQIELTTIASFLSALGGVIHSYAQTGNIETGHKHAVNDSLKEVLRMSVENEQKKLLAPVNGHKETVVLTNFLTSFADALEEFVQNAVIPPNYQTDLKTKLKELLGLGE